MNPSLKITANSLSTFLADFLKGLEADVENKPGRKSSRAKLSGTRSSRTKTTHRKSGR